MFSKVTLTLFLLSTLIVGSQALITGDKCSITLEADGVTENDPCPYLHNCIQNKCVHKTIFPPEPIEIAGSIVLLIVVGLANAGGISGAFLMTPLLIIFFNYSANGAVRVVYGVVLGGGIGSYLTRVTKREKDTKKPIINYEFGLIGLPVLVMGSTIGVILNKVLPSVVTIIGLILILARTFKTVYLKAKKVRSDELKQKEEKEKKLKEQAAQAQEMAQIQKAPAVETKTESPRLKIENDSCKNETTSEKPQAEKSSFEKEEARKRSASSKSNSNEETEVREEVGPKVILEDIKIESHIPSEEEKAKAEKLKKVLKEEQKLFPWKRYAEYFMLLGFMAVISILRGTKSYHPIGIEYCSPVYWVVYAMMLPGCFLIYLRGKSLAIKADKARADAGYDFGKQFRITNEKIAVFRNMAFMTGLLASMVGIGGGLIMVPALVDWGMQSMTATATSGFFIIFQAIASLLVVILAGDISVGELAFLFIIGLVGSYVIASVVQHYALKWGRQSLVLNVMVAMVTASLLFMIGYAIYLPITNLDGYVSPGEVC